MINGEIALSIVVVVVVVAVVVVIIVIMIRHFQVDEITTYIPRRCMDRDPLILLI
jgi:hypothetical protein